MAGLAGDLEGDTVGGGVLELEGGGREVVEILVEELERRAVSNSFVSSGSHSGGCEYAKSRKQPVRPFSCASPAEGCARGRAVRCRTQQTKVSRRTRVEQQSRGAAQAKLVGKKKAYIVGRLGNVGEGGDRHDGRAEELSSSRSCGRAKSELVGLRKRLKKESVMCNKRTALTFGWAGRCIGPWGGGQGKCF